MADIFTLTIYRSLGSETKEGERAEIHHLLLQAAQVVGSPGRAPEPLVDRNQNYVGEYEFGTAALNSRK